MFNLLRVLVLLTIFLTPLLGPGSLGYEQTKVVFFFIMTSLSGLVWLYLISKDEIKLKTDKLTIWGGIFIGWLFISSFLGINPIISLIGASPYLQGAFTYLYLFIFFLIIRDAKIPFNQICWVLSLSGLVVALVAIKEWLLLMSGVNILTYDGRVISTFGQPNLYSGFLLFCLPFVWYLRRGPTPLALVGVGPLFLILAIFISESRAAILGLLVLTAGILFYQLKKLPLTIKIVAGFLGVCLITISIWSFYQVNLSKELTLLNDPEWLIHNSPEKRFFVWPIFWELIMKSPIVGYGLENIPEPFKSFFAVINFNTLSNPLFHSLKDLNIDRSHNYILDLLMFSGGVGLIIWLVLCVLIFKRMKSNTLRAGLLIYLAWIQLQPQGLVQILFFWTILGLAVDKEV